jgi:hypothetical protein
MKINTVTFFDVDKNIIEKKYWDEFFYLIKLYGSDMVYIRYVDFEGYKKSRSLGNYSFETISQSLATFTGIPYKKL